MAIPNENNGFPRKQLLNTLLFETVIKFWCIHVKERGRETVIRRLLGFKEAM